MQIGVTIKGVPTPPRATVASAAGLLSAEDAAQLRDVALGLPKGWVLSVTAPHGQLSILPRPYVRCGHRTWVADAELGVVYRIDARRGVRFPG